MPYPTEQQEAQDIQESPDPTSSQLTVALSRVERLEIERHCAKNGVAKLQHPSVNTPMTHTNTTPRVKNLHQSSAFQYFCKVKRVELLAGREHTESLALAAELPGILSGAWTRLSEAEKRNCAELHLAEASRRAFQPMSWGCCQMPLPTPMMEEQLANIAQPRQTGPALDSEAVEAINAVTNRRRGLGCPPPLRRTTPQSSTPQSSTQQQKANSPEIRVKLGDRASDHWVLRSRFDKAIQEQKEEIRNIIKKHAEAMRSEVTSHEEAMRSAQHSWSESFKDLMQYQTRTTEEERRSLQAERNSLKHRSGSG
jgi:hypothetical protein